ncbi:SPOR domain-containing protein [Ferrimonas sp. YFM]|uniref:SPOR domain-containing protein n=1 Tax=Ferrimonas sp. YFM TaxID=3028878 RepID=UPI0025739EF2|nr:SPOR domain-containing protein [Ferrimonas sp. YFM]BDY06108.1 cell division protein DedD [Ferrimonas sp. YFM]
MSDQLKNRIVGTLVLTALAVIFLPNLLDGEKRRLEENFATIPLGPVALPQGVPERAFEEITLEPEGGQAESVAEPVASASPADTTKKAEPVQTASVKSEPKPAAKSSGVKTGWTLQVGSFRNAKNVTKLVNELREKGFRAYSVPSRPVEGKINRVFVGPDVSKSKLEKEQLRLAKATDLKGALVPYKATDI